MFTGCYGTVTSSTILLKIVLFGAICVCSVTVNSAGNYQKVLSKVSSIIFSSILNNFYLFTSTLKSCIRLHI